MKTFKEIYEQAMSKAKLLGDNYISLLELERSEIEKQGAEQYWVELYEVGTKFKTNNNLLILPYLLGLTAIDPSSDDRIKPRLDKKLDIINDPGAYKDKDCPDIDIDFMPSMRNIIKDYATTKYGSDKVCSVGSWQTYHPRSALKDVARSFEYKDKLPIIEKMTKNLPDEFDSMPLEDAIENYGEFKDWYFEDTDNREIAKYAFKLVGKVKAQSKHAGGLIISSVPLVEYLPMSKIGKKGKEIWTSEWTEGMSDVQLSKFGFIKYDILGLTTLQYIYEACKLIKKTKGIDIDWEEIGLDDEESLKTASELKTDSIFQLDTDTAKSILSKGGVKKFTDILVYTSLGRPGPMPMVDEYIKRRDATNEEWKKSEHPKVLELLGDTLGICTFQEQLTSMLTNLAGFTVPEAEKARKIMSKKWKDQMIWVRDKILTGMGNSLKGECNLKRPEHYKYTKSDINKYKHDKSNLLPETVTAIEVDKICGNTDWTWEKEYWKRLETFARYSFNKCLDADTILENPNTGELTTIEELYNNRRKYQLLSFDCNNGVFVDEVADIHYNGFQDVYEVEFTNGHKQRVTIGHKFLNEFMEMETVGELLESKHAIKCTSNAVGCDICDICHIKSSRYIGIRKTYSPEMKSKHHNYITTTLESGSPVHENSHAVSYSLQCYRCLYLKTHYPLEWWCSVLNSCDNDKTPNYIRIARAEGILFDNFNVNHLSEKFDVTENGITPGLLGIKGVGKKITEQLDTNINDIKTIGDFVTKQSTHKTLIERLIMLGAFDKLYDSRKALWYLYEYQFGKTKESTKIRKVINNHFVPSDEEIEQARKEKYAKHKKKHPNSKTVPKHIREYIPPVKPTEEQVLSMIDDDYSYEEKLNHQLEFLGYYWDSPMKMYYSRGYNIPKAKKPDNSILECVILQKDVRRTKNGNMFYTLSITDGLELSKLQVWSNEVAKNDDDIFEPGNGIRATVRYDEKFKSFSIMKSTKVLRLSEADDPKKIEKYIEKTRELELPEIDDEDYEL